MIVEEIYDDEKVCRNCHYAYKRIPFSFKKYGSFQCAFECNFDIKQEKYVRLDDTCEHFEERRKNNGQ